METRFPHIPPQEDIDRERVSEGNAAAYVIIFTFLLIALGLSVIFNGWLW